MSKKEILIEFIMQDIVAFIVADNNIEIDEAMNIFYNSTLFQKLQEIETGLLYLESSAYIYDILKDEINSGKLVQ